MRCSWICVLLLCWTVGTFAQSRTGEVRVSVRDEQGAVIRASLGLSDQAAHVQQKVVISGDSFTFKNLPLGNYRLTVDADGFAPISRMVDLSSEVPLSLQIVMPVRAAPTTVDV